jgi:hypothetical protein
MQTLYIKSADDQEIYGKLERYQIGFVQILEMSQAFSAEGNADYQLVLIVDGQEVYRAYVSGNVITSESGQRPD